MSRETLNWLNTNTLIGFTDKLGHAWHWRAQEQDGTSNHYPGPIPVTDVQDRVFGWLDGRQPPAGHRGRGQHAVHDPPVRARAATALGGRT